MKVGDTVRIINPSRYYEYLEGCKGEVINMSRDLIFVNVNFCGTMVREAFYECELESIEEE